MMDIEFEDIKRLVRPGSRKQIQAKARLRAYAIIETSLAGKRSQPSESELSRLAARVKRARGWRSIFPGIKRLAITTEGSGGLNVTLRISKSRGVPVQLVKEGTPGATVIAVKRTDELGFYSLNLRALSDKVGLGPNKTLAVIRHLQLQTNPDFFKEFRIGSARFKRYSPNALDKIKKELPTLDLDAVWARYKPTGRPKVA